MKRTDRTLQATHSLLIVHKLKLNYIGIVHATIRYSHRVTVSPVVGEQETPVKVLGS